MADQDIDAEHNRERAKELRNRFVGATQFNQGNVVDADGTVIGSISLKQIIDAIARPVEDSGQEARYR